MSFIETTLVVRGDVAASQADVLADSVADAASNGYLLIQKDGVAQAGNAAGAAATSLLKLSVAANQPDGSTAISGTSEFKLSDIYSYSYAAPSTGVTQTYTITNLGTGESTVRLEVRDGVNVHDVMSFSGTSATAIVAEFNGRADKERFKHITMSVNGGGINLSVAPNGYSTVVTGSDHLTIGQNAAWGPSRGGQNQVIALEKRSNISMGAYNQTEFPIVVPASGTAAGADYGIFTIELRKTLPGKRKVTEVIRIAIQDDEAASNKLVNAIQTILGLSGIDVTPPTALTSIQFVTDADGDTDAANEYSVQSASAMFVKIVGAEVGATITVTLTVTGGEDVVETFTASATTEVLSLAVTAATYAEGDVVSVNATQTDTNGNVGPAVTTADTATIQA